MGKVRIFVATVFAMLFSLVAVAGQAPWVHGRLTVSENGHFLMHADGTPFFWLGNTGWLMPQKLTRADVDTFIGSCALNGYNVIQIQVLNDVPSTNVYGNLSHNRGWDMGTVDDAAADAYWRHLDYIIDRAADNGIYIGMVCIWGGLVKSGKMNVEQAREYGSFLAGRYRDRDNIIWIIGGDIKGDVKADVWQQLAEAIKENDNGHLITFHPFGRTSSAWWWHQAEWLDMNMFQSGHRRYDQTRGDGDDRQAASVAEDNWRYVDDAYNRLPAKPVVDAEPSYEDIPQGLHDVTQPRWLASDVRRYAYWAVFAGAAGHTYGNNSMMQFYRVGDEPAYGANRTWQQTLADEGYCQMQYLKRLMMRFPYFERVPDQSILAAQNGERYNRAIATRGTDYLLVYTYTNAVLTVDLDKITGASKNIWWMNPRDGKLEFAGTCKSGNITFQHPGDHADGNDRVLIAVDASKNYLTPADADI